MSTENRKNLGKKLKNILTNARPELHLAKVDQIQPDSYCVSLTFFYPDTLKDISLEKVPLLRNGVGWMPTVGDEVVVEYIGKEFPLVSGVYKQASWNGMSTGKEWTLGTKKNVLISDDGKVTIQNDSGSIEITAEGAITIKGPAGNFEMDAAGMISLGNSISDLGKVINRMSTMFAKISVVPFAPTATLAPAITQDLIELPLEIAALLK